VTTCPNFAEGELLGLEFSLGGVLSVKTFMFSMRTGETFAAHSLIVIHKVEGK
jgi:hypothetical protein